MKSSIGEFIKDATITRRRLFQVGALAGAAVALGGMAEPATALAAAESGSSGDPEKDGKWIPVDCWDNCGGGCLNKVLMYDGVAIRQKTDDTHADSFDWPQQRSCPRGHSQRMQVFAPDRLKYPMKRKHWEPITGGDKSLRGRDEWERISWDEAFDYIAAELKHIKDNYGPRALLMPHKPNPAKQVCHGVAVKYLGGFVQELDSHSYGNFGFDVGTIGIKPMGWVGTIDRYSLQKCKNIVLYSCNPAWASAGSPSVWLNAAKDNGSSFVFVGPEYNVTAAQLDARWIPVRPGTDVAFLLGVAHTMLKNDKEKGNVVDWDFLNRYTVGFDGDHMPEDATTDENFLGYLQGDYDGVEKDAAWASERCGTPVEDIEWYADLMGKENSVGIFHSFGAARCNGAEGFPQMFHTIGAMGGHMGKLGHACVNCNENGAFNAMPGLFTSGEYRLPLIKNPLDEWVVAPELWDAVVDGKYNYTGNYLYGSGKPAPSEIRDLDIHMIWHSHEATMHTIANVNKAIEAHRKVDFVLADGFFYTPNVQYADIVLPAATPWESWAPGDNKTGIFPSKVIDPLYESKPTYWIAGKIAERLGIPYEEIVPKTEEQRFFDFVTGAKAKEGGQMKPVAALTQEDIDHYKKELGIEWDEGPRDGIMPIGELIEKGVYTPKRSKDDGIVAFGWKEFVEDPEKNPLTSNSGKFEIYCQKYADECNAMGRSTIKPYPAYYPDAPGTYQSSFKDWDKKEPGEYTFSIYTPHYLRRMHAVLDNVPWVREAFVNPVYMNAGDAEKKGIKTGDTVIIKNQRGSILRQAALTHRVMPGVIGLPHGSWPDHDENGIDRGGTENVLIGGPTSGWGVSGYNTTLASVEKYDGEPLKPDCELPARMPKVKED